MAAVMSGERRLLARSEFQRGGLLSCAEGFEHCAAVAANAEGEQRAQAETQ